MDFKDKYQKVKIIRTSGFGILIEVKEKNNDKNHYAIKALEKNLYEDYKKEIQIMKNIKSEYVIELIDNFYDEKNGLYCIVMELCDGDLRQILYKYKPKGLPLNIINKIFIQLNDALKAMIKIDYTHRDLKPENILIKYTDNNKINFDIRLTDFGLSSNEIHSTINNHSCAGSKIYMAPEIEKFNYNNKSDLWSIGVILYELYTNKYIFDSKYPKEREINRYDGKIINETDNEMINKLIRKLIQVDIEKRIKWEEYFDDEFFLFEIYVGFKVNYNYELVKIFNGNKDINKNNIKIYFENKEFKEEFNNLKKGFYNAIIKIKPNINNYEEMFKDCRDIIEINFLNFDTKNVINMKRMFDNCSSLNKLEVTKFDTKLCFIIAHH